MNIKARSFVTTMVVIGICALVLRVAIDKLIKITVYQNESQSKEAIALISAALENFATDNNGTFPARFDQLTAGKPVYLDKDYVAVSPVRGYVYECSRLEATGYLCQATPSHCGLTGNTVFKVSTSSVLEQERCGSKEQ